MSRGRRQMIQLDEPPARSLYSNEPTYNSEMDQDDDEDEDMGDMPTPERLVTEDMIPDRYRQPPTGEMDNKVANFLAEIDALDEPPVEQSRSPAPVTAPVPEPVVPAEVSPPRDRRSPVRSKPNAYSSMFVKGTPEFVKPKKEERSTTGGQVQLETWPEEPHTDWQQLKDENTNYPYYWNTQTNAVVWDMPPEFSQFLLRQKEYEEKVERGLREGKLNPKQREQKINGEKQTAKDAPKNNSNNKGRDEDQRSRSHNKGRRGYSSSEDSSSDSSDSEGSLPRDKRDKSPGAHSREKRDRSPGARGHGQSKQDHEKVNEEVSSSSTLTGTDKPSQSKSSLSPDTTRPDDRKSSKGPVKVEAPDDDDSMDFDIDDIDKQLELALEKKRQELMKTEEDKVKEEKASDKHKSDRKKVEHKHGREDDRHRKHSKHDRDRDRDRDRKRDRESERDERKPKLTLKERLRIEMELKLEKEKRKKKAIEDLMARELEKTVGSSSGRSHKRHHDDRDKSHGYKRYRHDDDIGHGRGGGYDDYRDEREYDGWDRRGGYGYDRFIPEPDMKPPPPTAEMLAYEEERKSQVVDYGHGRSNQYDGDSDPGDARSADAREMEVKKLEALGLAELALSKLEFLEVTKKGLSKLQILLIELETRHQDWQAGGLTTNHFLGKLREANWQLEQYESSAAPAGWACSWDRDYRRYFYTHKLTGKTQWDYPDHDEIKTEEEKGKQLPHNKTTTREKTSQETEESVLLANASLPPPPPPPAEEHPSVKSLQLMYGSDSDTEETTQTQNKPVEESLLPTELPPLPPEPPLEREIEKKDKKKKKKKEKSKKKDRKDISDSGVAGPIGPVGPTYPVSQPPPPGEDSAQPMETANFDQQIPVYGSVGNDQYAMNDMPLEFGSVIEAAPQPDHSATIAAAPQTQTKPADHSHESEHYNPSVTGSGDHAGEADSGAQEGASGTSEATIGAVPATEEKKKRKKMGSGSISLKKKHVSSMVQKWQKVKKEVELEERDRQLKEAEIRKKLAELD